MTFRNSIGAVGGKAGEINRDAIIAVRRHVIPLRGKEWVIHDWKVMRTYVEILRGTIEMSFGVFLQFWFHLYNYNCKLYMFDRPIDVPMRIAIKLICSCIECES